ncbi:MAG: 4Fe-4S binding protein [Acidilobaceae archaeon]
MRLAYLWDSTKCIGCMACVVACPYNARWVHPSTLVPEKCPGPTCIGIIKEGEKSICVSVCPANARDFGDIDDPKSSISVKIFRNKTERPLEPLGTEPKYFIVLG